MTPMKISYPSIIAEEVTVNRDRTQQQALDATGRRQYTDSSVVATMPRGGIGTETVTVEFFNLGRSASDDEVDRELEKRHLVSDPYAVAAVNEADPAFADKYPNSTHWKNANGKWFFAAFDCVVGGRIVGVYRSDDDWDGCWWVGGVRKLSA